LHLVDRHQWLALKPKEQQWTSRSGNLTWQLLFGDFLETMKEAKVPDIIFFDPFSAKTNGPLWSLDSFSTIYHHCVGHDTVLVTYSTSTAIRATLLAAGFYVAEGPGCGGRESSTVALTPKAYHRFLQADSNLVPLGAPWLSKWHKSTSAVPASLTGEKVELFRRAITTHQQFASLH
jgi:queuine tRNA-ribosyltransferase